MQEEGMNPWQKYERAIKEGEITKELFIELFKLAQDAKEAEFCLSQKIDTATRILHGV